MHWLHEREVLTLSEWFVFEEGKKSLSESKSTRRRHTMFEHLDEVPLRHHRFIISLSKEFLLSFKSCSLIKWIIELRKPISDFTSGDDRLESFYSSRMARRLLRERRDDLRVIHEKCRSRDLLTDIFPESVCETLTIIPFIFHTKFSKFCLHLIISGSEEIDPCF